MQWEKWLPCRLKGSDKQRVFGGGLFGLGLLVVAAIMSHGSSCGCIKAEMLAINDNGEQISDAQALQLHTCTSVDVWCGAEHQHRRLVRYYTRLGFQYVREIGDNGLSDLPHLLVWGGAGTRMNINPESMLRQWLPLLQRMNTSK